jgi:tetratricopeptide (TPR) repeat protein
MPREGAIWFDLGRSYRDYRRLDDAERAFAMSCVLKPTGMNHWFDLARVLLDRVPRGQERTSPLLQIAVAAARAAFATGPDPDPPMLLERALLFNRAGLADEARRDCEAALERAPSDSRALALRQTLGR